MAKKRSDITPLVPGNAPGKANPGIKVPGLVGSKAGKVKRGKRSGKTLRTISGTSSVSNPPTGGGY